MKFVKGSGGFTIIYTYINVYSRYTQKQCATGKNQEILYLLVLYESQYQIALTKTHYLFNLKFNVNLPSELGTRKKYIHFLL